jgi:phosphatidylserine/phosphatidylglycerophosphate/cardiolipin synthase-like enzyme
VARDLAAAGIRCGLDSRERPLHCHHEKTIVVDDRVAFVGGMDLTSQDGDRFDPADHNDTEMNVVTHDPDLARRTRLRLWAEHLELNESEGDEDPVSAIERRWKPISEEQLERRRAGKPLTHRLVLLPYVSRRSARLLGPLQGLLVDG